MSIVTWLDKQQLRQRVTAGTFMNLASPTSTEIAAAIGFDWLLFDFEHGAGGESELRPLLLACRDTATAPIVRVRSADPDIVKFVMDSGAAGVMFPFVNCAKQAQAAVAAIKYPPEGKRGVAGQIRATDYGLRWKDYFDEANARSLVVAQIETVEAVQNADEIAAVEGVDVLFVGPLDLSVSLGQPGDFSNPEFKAALNSVVAACQKHEKTAGILSKSPHLPEHLKMGFQFVAYGSDLAAVSIQLQSFLSEIRQ